MSYEDCGHRYVNGVCELTNKYCEQSNAYRSCYESEFIVKRMFGITAKEKRPDEDSEILKRLKARYRTYQLSYADKTLDAKLIKDAIDELERLYSDKK